MYSSYAEYLNLVCDKENFFFIQIGAHEGGTVNPERKNWSPHIMDPLHFYIKKYSWKGILVEPHNESFQILKSFYKKEEENLIFEEIAITESRGKVTLYMSSLTELSSLSKHNHEPHRNLIASKTVESLSINDLCKKHNVQKYDLLQIDTEGYDAKIVKNIDFNIGKPEAICFEHRHCAKKDLLEACEHLKKHSYKLVFSDDFDNLYIKENNY